MLIDDEPINVYPAFFSCTNRWTSCAARSTPFSLLMRFPMAIEHAVSWFCCTAVEIA